ncbi:MAG: hypothetical protein VX278_00560, partial [Myxococcota bacterium]|nr:hypothetical protein [Myxococcota bacterium]
MRLYLSTFVLLAACDVSDKGVTAYNSKPEVVITSHGSGAELQDGYLTNFVGQVSDANHQNSDLLVTWSTNNGPLCLNTTPSNSGETICEAVVSENDTELILQAVDPGGGTGIERMDITVLPTQTPSCEITSPEEVGVYYSDQLVTFSGVLTDAEDDASLLSGHWRSSRDELLGEAQTPTSDGLIQIYETLTEGQHAIEFHGIDSTGKTCLDSVIIDVGAPNSAPLCEITAPVSGVTGVEGDMVPFAATASDVDIPSDMLTVTWNSDKDGVLGESTPTSAGDITFAYADLSVNQHNITMTVADELGATCTTAINYTVGTPPSITIDAPLDGETYSAGEALSFSATVSDSQDQPDEIALDWTLNGTSVST